MDAGLPVFCAIVLVFLPAPLPKGGWHSASHASAVTGGYAVLRQRAGNRICPPCRIYRFRAGIRACPESGAAAEIPRRLLLPLAAAARNPPGLRPPPFRQGGLVFYSLMTAPALSAAIFSRIYLPASSGVSLTCSPLSMSLTERTPSFISSSPIRTAKGTPILSA